jgi:hypothetical protein
MGDNGATRTAGECVVEHCGRLVSTTTLDCIDARRLMDTHNSYTPARTVHIVSLGKRPYEGHGNAGRLCVVGKGFVRSSQQLL